jgi:hypothetical protein
MAARLGLADLDETVIYDPRRERIFRGVPPPLVRTVYGKQLLRSVRVSRGL